ncbi:MAG: molecular chaperone [Acidobacteria bacterium]|nr:molecular chaperone [Acidobacteriota bacterium]
MAGALLVAPPSSARSSFTVNPTQIHLGGRTTTALLTLRNEEALPLRFQLSVFSWNQDSRGEMELDPTDDIVFYPPLLTLAPGEERRIRIGAATAFGPVERTYRIFVEELPPESEGDQGAVRMLTKMGIPIFLRPAEPVAQAALEALRLTGGTFGFHVRNAGTVHFVPQDVRVRGFGLGKEVVFDRHLDGWYILAGGTRAYEVQLGDADCSRLHSLAVEVLIASSTLSDELDVDPAACRSSAAP